MIRKISICLIFFALCSCANKTDVVYFNNLKLDSQAMRYEPRLQPDDILLIFVSSSTPEAASDFNLIAFGSVEKNSDVALSQVRFQTYLINNEGFIQFPVLGKIKLGGLTRSEALAKMESELKKYLKDPIVNLRINNYKVSVLGEVVRPGEYAVASERVTLLEALSMAGDLTIYGQRHNVLIVREIDGVKTYNYVDIASSEFFNSPFYYLSQNDMVYVSPNKTRINASMVGPNTTIILSSISLLLTVVALIIR